MSKTAKIWAIVGAIVVLIVFMFVGMFNGLVASRETVETRLGDIQSQYQRRADLIPNLVSTVKGAANFEKSTLTEVTDARARATQMTLDPSNATPEQIAAYQNAQGELSQALGRLLAVAENYPELTATQNFKDLQVQLEGTENRITVARNDFNEAARSYNTSIKTFPRNIFAGMFGFEQYSYFEADQGADVVPQVEFGD